MKESRGFARKNMDGEVKIFTNGGVHLGGLRPNRSDRVAHRTGSKR